MLMQFNSFMSMLMKHVNMLLSLVCVLLLQGAKETLEYRIAFKQNGEQQQQQQQQPTAAAAANSSSSSSSSSW
jgi:hypothetical protein